MKHMLIYQYKICFYGSFTASDIAFSRKKMLGQIIDINVIDVVRKCI